MVRVIAEKAERMSASGAQWLHLTVLTGLWAFTDWGCGPLEDKAPTMSTALVEALGDHRPLGVVLTSAPSLAPDDMGEELAQCPAGLSLRIGVQALRGRESLIMPLTAEAVQTSEDWLALARAERSWLDWALARRGLPMVAEMLSLP